MSDRLPDLEGTTLSGRTIRFPEDLPEPGLVLVIGFTHAARHDVGAWKASLGEVGQPFLSLPTSAVDTLPEQMEGVAVAMRAHVPTEGWGRVVQIHRGGPALLAAFGWAPDVYAKVLRVAPDGAVLGHHGKGPFSPASLAQLLGAEDRAT